MRRGLLIGLFGALGLVYVFVLPFLIKAVVGGNGAQYFGSDEVNRQLQVYFLLGKALFSAMWAWVGNALALAWRRGLWMVTGLLLGTAAAVTSLRFAADRMEPIDSEGLIGFVLIWALVCGSGAYLAGRIFDRVAKRSDRSMAGMRGET